MGRWVWATALAAVTVLALGACGVLTPSPTADSIGAAGCPTVTPITADAEATVTRGSDQVLQPTGFAALAEGVCVWEVVGTPELGDSAVVIFVSPNSAEGPAFMDKVRELAMANGFSVNESESPSRGIKGSNDAFDYYQFDYYTEIDSDMAVGLAAWGLDLEAGDSIIIGSVTARVDQAG